MKQKQLIPYGAIRSALRRLWLWSDTRKEAIKLCKVSRGKYRCNQCYKLFSLKQLQVDHIVEIGKLVSWDDYITKLFCSVDNLQVLCIDCHKEKHK